MDSLKDLSQGPRKGPDTQVKTAPGASFDHWILVALASLLTACGSSSDSPIAVDNNNHPPRIITDSTVQMPEQRQLVSSLLAIDTDSDPVLWSISGGADAALFRMDAEGRLKFIVAPDFENPADTNLDNLYELSVTVSDGISADTKQLNVEVTDRLEGRVGGDPVTGAKVFLDLNGNSQLDLEEPQAITSDSGHFIFGQSLPGADRERQLVALAGRE
ncbi:MAG: Ig-like domain-containing protein, partial [Porticoccaceae bacterium]